MVVGFGYFATNIAEECVDGEERADEVEHVVVRYNDRYVVRYNDSNNRYDNLVLRSDI